MQLSMQVHGQRHGINGLFLTQHSLATIPREVSMPLLVAMWFWPLQDISAQFPMAQQTMAGMAVSRFEPEP